MLTYLRGIFIQASNFQINPHRVDLRETLRCPPGKLFWSVRYPRYHRRQNPEVSNTGSAESLTVEVNFETEHREPPLLAVRC